MTNSRAEGFAAMHCLERILGRLDSSIIARSIDLPIDVAREAFETTLRLPLDRGEFDRLIGEFIAHLNRCGCRLRRNLATTTSWYEAVRMLNGLRGSRQATGYEQTLLDVVHDQCACMEDVLVMLTEAVKAVEKTEYRAWVYATELDVLDWKQKCCLTEVILDSNGGDLRGRLHGGNPDSFPHHLPDLLDAFQSIQQRVRSCAPNTMFEGETAMSTLPLAN